MSVSHLYKDFAYPKQNDAKNVAAESELQQEEAKLASFEDGYKSGWDDAISAQAETNTAIAKDFGRNLQEASFSFHEARSGLAREVREVLEPAIASLLPELAKETLPAHIGEQVSKLASEAMETTAEVAVSPKQLMQARKVCEERLSSPFEIVPDDNIQEDQVFIRVGTQEREIDVKSCIDEVQSILRAFFEKIEKGD